MTDTLKIWRSGLIFIVVLMMYGCGGDSNTASPVNNNGTSSGETIISGRA